MVEKAPFTHAQVLEMFGYDSNSGRLLWKIRPSNRTNPGDPAGQVGGNGRCYIGIDGKRYLAHRLVWFHQKGVWPTDNIAPINGDYLDTRIENLKSETPTETAQKGGLRSTNKSGVKGVSWNTKRERWVVHVYRNYQTVCIGQFRDLGDAIKAKRAADIGEFASDEKIAEANRERKAITAIARRCWANMLNESKGDHTWLSLDEFYTDVGDPPQLNYNLRRVDEEKPIGPGNFQWVAPLFDRRTREGRLAAGKVSYESNYEKIRDKFLQKKFGISSKDFDAKLLDQNGVCANCGGPQTRTRKGKTVALDVDHCHATGKVRGLLCDHCNTGLGKFRDRPDLLRKAADYIERWQRIHSGNNKSKEASHG